MFLTEIVNLVNAGYGQSHEFINDKTRGERGVMHSKRCQGRIEGHE